MSNLFGAAAGDGTDDGTVEQVAKAVADVFADATSTIDGAGDAATDDATTDADVDLDAGLDGDVDLADLADLLSDAGVDAVWLDLDGDLIPETMIPTDGPFDVEADGAEAYDDWSAAEAYDLDIVSGELDGQDLSILLPVELEAGYPDPFVLSEADWSECGVYDPMTAAPDWTVDGYAEFTEIYTVPGMEGGFSDAGGYYDTSMPTTGYWDVNSYYDTAGGYLDGATSIDTWDLPMTAPTGFDGGMGMDGGMGDDAGAGYGPGAGFDTGAGYDATSSWDPTAGDAQHEAFLDTITGDYSDPSSSWDASSGGYDSQFWMDQYDAASDLSWDAWGASVDASIAGDGMAAYDLNQTSLAFESYANDAWSYSSDVSSYATTSSSSADDGWYDAMSLD